MYNPPNLKDASPGKGKSLKGKPVESTKSGKQDLMFSNDRAMPAGKGMPVADGKLMWNVGRGPISGNQNGISDKVARFQAQNKARQATADQVSKLWNIEPPSLNINRAGSVAKGKVKANEDIRYTDRLAGTM